MRRGTILRVSQSRSKFVGRLGSALRTGAPVTVVRKYLDESETSGFVIAVLDDWVVLQDYIGGAHLDAVVLLRLDQVTSVKMHADTDYLMRAVAGLGVPLETFDCPSDGSVGELLRVIAARAELAAVRLETPKGEWFNIGKIKRIGGKRLDLHFIGRDGVWVDFVEAWKLRDITRLEFGGLYIRALEQFGDPMPQTVKRIKR